MKKETLQWIKSNPVTQAGENGAHLDIFYGTLVSLRCTDRASWETAWTWQPRSAGNASRAKEETPSPKSRGAWGNIKEMGWSWLVSQNSNLRFIGYLSVLQLLSGGREIVASFPSVRKAQFPQTDPSWSGPQECYNQVKEKTLSPFQWKVSSRTQQNISLLLVCICLWIACSCPLPVLRDQKFIFFHWGIVG